MIDLRDVTGTRGEKIVELCLTEYSQFKYPLFRPGFLGEKWPAIDFYVELTSDTSSRLFFFGQAKTTTRQLTASSKHLRISTQRMDVERLLNIPAPTYILGVHEPSKRVFAKSVHAGMPKKAISSIPVTHELTASNLKRLYDEVVTYWSTVPHKPTTSVFG